MIGYPYIQQLFQTILDKSYVIQGRFFVCPKWGSELSNPNISEAIAIGQAKEFKYPVSLLMPPPKEGNFEYSGEALSSGNVLWNVYSIQMLFLTNARNTGQNQVTKPDNAGISTHTIPETWHDMDRVAENFCAVLQGMIQKLGNNIVFWDEFKPRIQLVSNIGNDGASGVKLIFKLGLFGGCKIEDYPDTWKDDIIPPDITKDIHKLHTDL